MLEFQVHVDEPSQIPPLKLAVALSGDAVPQNGNTKLSIDTSILGDTNIVTLSTTGQPPGVV